MGGLNAVASEMNMGPTQIRQSTNVLLSQYGDAVRRGGTQRTSVAAIAATSVRNGFCWRTATTHEYLVACNSRLYSGGVYGLPMTWTDKGLLTSATAYPSFIGFRDGAGEVCYLADGALFKYTGGVKAAVAGTPALAQVAVYNQRLFGITGNDQTVHYSDLNNGDTCGVASATSGSAVVRTFSNQKLTGLLALSGSLAMFHVSGVSRFVGLTQDDIAIGAGLNGISTDTGTIAPRSAVSVEGIGYFLSERGAFRITDQGVTAIDTPQSPDPTRALLSVLPATTFTQIDAVHDKVNSTVRWYIPDVGVYVYAYRLNAWSGPHTGIFTSTITHCLFDGIDNNGEPILLSGHADGYVRLNEAASFRDDVLSDGTVGTTYPMAVKCRRFYTDQTASEKAWRWAYLFADLRGSTGCSVSWRADSGSSVFTVTPNSSGTVWGSSIWNASFWGGTGNRPYRIPLSNRGTFLDLTITDTSAVRTIFSRVDIQGFDYGRR